MTMVGRRVGGGRWGRRVILLAALAPGLASPALAQAPEALSIRAARRDTITAGATLTAAFMIASSRPDSTAVRLRLELPTDWMSLTGSEPVMVAPQAIEMFILSVVVPARTLAGTYPVRVWATSGSNPEGVSDSVVVRVPARSATDVTLLDRPGYVISGRGYESGFQVRNRGNQATTLRIAARGSVGTATLSDSVLRLEPDESHVVRARVRTPAGLNAAVDDVVEIIVRHAATSAGGVGGEPVRGSSRVTVVPEPSRSIERFLRIPTRVNLRASSSSAVSPFEAFGQGPVRDGGSARLEFLVRGPTGPASAFGERDEYRVDLRAPDWRVRGGDQVFMLTSLTAAGQPGFGLGADGRHGALSAGAYSQQFRRAPEKGTEHAGFVAVRPLPGTRLGVNLVQRAGGVLPGTVASGSASLAGEQLSADVELARSRSASGGGVARTARINGRTDAGSFDLGHLFADTAFGGSQRGAEHNYLTASSVPLGVVSFGVNGSLHRTDLSRSTGVQYQEAFNTAALSATLFQRVTIEANRVHRGTTIESVTHSGDQWGLRGRADHDFARYTLTLEGEGGESRDAAGMRRFHEVGLGARRMFGWGHGALYAQRYSGGSLIKGMVAAQTVGGDASVRLGRSFLATVIAYATRQETRRAEWHSQMDAMLSKGLRGGSTISLRARALGGGNRTGSQQNVMFLEYGMPLRLPVSQLRTTGRVTGRVVDAVSGRGVPGALVRLGPQVAITDRNGEVSFGGVPGGQHRLSMSQETSFANAVFVGDPTLVVDSTRVRPTTFSVAIARSARLDVDVRRFTAVRTAVNQEADSLREAGAVSNALLILAGERDTLYRSTGENGKVTFTDVPPGQWTLTVRGDTPAFTRFEPDRLELALAPGESRSLAFRLVPRRREVQLIGDGQELRPESADSKGGAPGATRTRTVKPDEKRPEGQ